MARAVAKPAVTANADIGGYHYEIADNVLTVTRGSERFQTPLVWAFGQGTVGTTFLFRRDNRWYESRVSWFSALKGLDITMGAQSITPHNIAEAAGRLIGLAEEKQCFGCHSTSSGRIEGVQCERCHGDASEHLRRQIPKASLGELSAGEMNDFCGQCHRTWEQVAANGPRGIQNIRFQPYRLANSKCFDASDRRIRCTACHDPHRDVETSAAAYDSKCTGCHSTCKVATKNCVTCHMPKLELPGAHHAFTDHWIRIVKAGGVYPE